MNRLRAAVASAPGFIALAWLALTPQNVAAATGPDLVNARLQGAWNLSVTVAGYTGPKQPGNRPVGHQATDRIWFDSTCPAPGSCSVRIWGPSGPDPSQAPYYTYNGNASGFEGTVGPNPLQQSGPNYSVSIPVSGFGGPLGCSPPGGGRPAQSLTLKVTDATPNGSGWLANTITGTEILVAGWGCNGSVPTAWVSQTLSIVGHPVGYVAPSSGAPSSTAELRVSTLAAALNTPAQAFRNPALLVANLVVTAIVILFVTFPSAIFNRTLSDNYPEIIAALRRLDPRRLLSPRRGGTSAWSELLRGRRREVAVFGGVLLAGALIDGLLDPGFGFNGTSLVSLVATISTLLFGAATSGLVAVTYRSFRGRSTSWYLRALPLGLVIAAACVLISRLTGFQPGYFYGLVCGVAFGTQLAKHEQGHTAAVGALVTMMLAVVAWFVWAAVDPLAGRVGASWIVVLITDFLASVFVGGLVGNVVGLLPLRSLQGGALIAWHRGAWAAVFGIAVFGLVQVLLHPEQGPVHPSQAPLVTAIVLFVGFGGASIAFNRYFTWGGRPTRLAASPAESGVGERSAAAGQKGG